MKLNLFDVGIEMVAITFLVYFLRSINITKQIGFAIFYLMISMGLFIFLRKEEKKNDNP